MNPPSDSLPLEARLIGRRLQNAFAADQVHLFGSHARGTAGPDSDLDFLVVVPASEKSRYQRAVEARGIVHDIVFPKDIIVLTREEWEADLTVVCSLASTVMREGIRVDA
jgi:predicted nucleotidyltransferase